MTDPRMATGPGSYQDHIEQAAIQELLAKREDRLGFYDRADEHRKMAQFHRDSAQVKYLEGMAAA
jgi:hypothetical protein